MFGKKIPPLVLILIIGALLRVIFLSSEEIIGDEPAYALRSIGWIDTLASEVQTTPYYWYPVLPWWATMSFHDHPPLIFAIQHLFFSFFGHSMAVARLPSVIAGILSILLIYAIGKKMFEEKIGLIAAGLFAIGAMPVIYARVALMESIALFFILTSIWFFFRSIENRKYLLLTGICLGLSILAKYVALTLIPVYAFIILLHRPKYWKQWHIYAAFALTLIVCLPIILYNYQLYRATGHFDVQFASFLQQKTPEWPSLLGKEQAGSLSYRIVELSHVATIFSPLFFIVSFAGLGYMILRRHAEEKTRLAVDFLLSALGIMLVFLLIAGPSGRFIYYTVPYFCISGAIFMKFIAGKCAQKKAYAIFAVIFIYEFIFSLNSVILAAINKNIDIPYFLSAPGLKTKNYGINKLDEFLNEKLRGKLPAITAHSGHPAIDKKSQEYIGSHPQEGVLSKTMIIYDSRIGYRTQAWVMAKRMLYEGWPTLSTDSVPGILKALDARDPNLIFYYVYTTENSDRSASTTYKFKSPDKIAEELNDLHIPFDAILTDNGLAAYKIYTFNVAVLRQIYSTAGKGSEK